VKWGRPLAILNAFASRAFMTLAEIAGPARLDKATGRRPLHVSGRFLVAGRRPAQRFRLGGAILIWLERDAPNVATIVSHARARPHWSRLLRPLDSPQRRLEAVRHASDELVAPDEAMPM